MNDKGFTLIELLAIVIVLAAIFLVSFPNLLSLSKKDEERKYEMMVEILCQAGNTYIYSNEKDYKGYIKVNNKIEISIKELMVNNLVKSNIVNPKTNNRIDNSKLEYTVMGDMSLSCRYIEN